MPYLYRFGSINYIYICPAFRGLSNQEMAIMKYRSSFCPRESQSALGIMADGGRNVSSNRNAN